MYNQQTNLPKGMSLAGPCVSPWFGCGAIVDANNAWPLGFLCFTNGKPKIVMCFIKGKNKKA